MEEHIEIIERAIFEFEESGRASKTAMARFIVGRLNDSGYELRRMPLPKDVELAQKYVTECHNDIGFMGSPEYYRQKKILDSYFEPIRQKLKDDEEMATYLRLKSKYENE